MEDVIVKLDSRLEGIPVGRPEKIREGDIWLEPIEAIFTTNSCDGGRPDDSVHTVADAMREWTDEDEDHYYSYDWRALLHRKRMDENYSDVKDSIARWGFVRPVTVAIEVGNKIEYGDGHHRLAAAIELGFTHVPVEAYDGYNISDDSGAWDGSLHMAQISQPRHGERW